MGIKKYTDHEYADKACQANAEGKALYILVKEEEVPYEVYEWTYKDETIYVEKFDEEGNPITHKETVEQPIYDEEGKIIGYDEPVEIDVPETEPKVVKVKDKPIMEKIIDPETGEEIEVQKHHTEYRIEEQETLEIAPFNYYICFEGIKTHGEVNPDYNPAKIREEAFLKEFFLIPAANNGEDIYYRRKPKGYTSAVESLMAALTIVNVQGKLEEGIIKVYPCPDFEKEEECTEEWLAEHIISLPEMTTKEFMMFYTKFLMAWNSIEHE